jgi:hypothetical protein
MYMLSAGGVHTLVVRCAVGHASTITTPAALDAVYHCN